MDLNLILQVVGLCLASLIMLWVSLDLGREISFVGTFARACKRGDYAMAWRVVKDGITIAYLRIRARLHGTRFRPLILIIDEFGGIQGPTNIGDHIKVVIGLAPVSGSGATVVGANGTTGFDRTGYSSVFIWLSVGLSGAITSVDMKIRHSDTIGGTYADFVPDATGSGALTQITANSTQSGKNINLLGAKQFVQVSQTIVGTSVLTASEMIFGGAITEPATNAQ